MNALRRLLHSVFGWTPDARSKANASFAENIRKTPDADKPSAARTVSDERRALNEAKRLARNAERVRRHAELMASKPGSRRS